MRDLSERGQIMSVSELWDEQYREYPPTSRHGRIGEKLRSLDLRVASAKEVIDITGNDSWVSQQTCDECGHVGWDMMEIGKIIDYDQGAVAYACSACLKKAYEISVGKR